MTEIQTKQQSFFSRTETIWNNHDPDFLKRVVVDYYFEQYQEVELKVFDADSESKDISKQNFMGSAKTTLAELAAAPDGKCKLSLFDRHGNILRGSEGEIVSFILERLTSFQSGESCIIVRTEQLVDVNHSVKFKINATGLSSSFGFGPAAFLEIARVNADNSLTMIHRTNVCG